MTLLAAIDDDLGDALAQIAEALQIPVLLLALLVLAACAVELGRFCGEAWQRARHGRQALRAAALEAVKRPHEALTLSDAAADAVRRPPRCARSPPPAGRQARRRSSTRSPTTSSPPSGGSTARASSCAPAPRSA